MGGRIGSARRVGVAVGLAVLMVAGLAPGAAGQRTSPLEERSPRAEAPAATPRDSLPVGVVVERVVSEADSTQSHALYLPSDYDPERRWPVLFVMDPRGDALDPLERFRPAAERFGYVVISSYDTRSDGPPEPNERAMTAMLSDVQRWLSVDLHRLYLAGFSGTTRAAWTFALRLPENVAGIAGFGAGLPAPLYRQDLTPLSVLEPFAYFGGAGTTDFNYEEMWILDEVLDAPGLAHRIAFWPGPHAWPPASVATEALAWMELRAMRTGLTAPDTAWMRARYEGALSDVDALASRGDTAQAVRALERIAMDFDGLFPVEGIRERVATMRGSEAMARWRARRERIAVGHRRYVAELVSTLDSVAASDPLPSVEEVAGRLSIRPLLEQSRQDEDPEGALAAGRLIAQAMAQLRFYRPRAHLEAGEPETALLLLEVASIVSPDAPGICLLRARAHAMAGDEEEVARAVRCARDGGVTTETLRSIEELDPFLSPSGPSPSGL